MRALPTETAQDWRTYADHLAVVTVVSEERAPRTEEEEAAGEGFADRILTFEVHDIVWSRDGAPESPRSVSTSIGG